jgi:hypothetical protein
LVLSGSSFVFVLLLGRPLNQIRGQVEIWRQIFDVNNLRRSFKGLSPSTTPFGKRKFMNVELTIPKATKLSISKMGL